jgi:hypothetical protein
VCSEYLADRGAGYQRQFARLGNRWAVSEHGIVLFRDGVENFLAAAAEQIEIEG